MIVDANPLVLVLQNFKRRVNIEVYNDSEVAIDPTELDLQIQRLDGSVIRSDSFTTPPPDGTRIVRTGAGQYYFPFGDPTAAANVPTVTETAHLCKYLFAWLVTGAAGTEEIPRVQTVEVVSAFLLDRIRAFREQIDKARKAVSVKPDDFCPLGYTDGMLLEYLRGGMTLINAYQPYPTFCRLTEFPDLFLQVLFDAALLVGVNAQTLFAIDSDIEQWSDQGNAFVINHQPKLAAFSQAMNARLETIIPKMKLHFVQSGTALVESGANFRLSALVSMAPSGSLFRNVFLRG